MTRQDLARLAAVACVACCAVPLLVLAGGIGVLTALATWRFGVLALVGGAAVGALALGVRRAGQEGG